MTFAQEWSTRIDREFEARNFTRTYRDVMAALPTFRGQGGQIFPSHEAIAKRASCSVRSVERALRVARDVGMVTWMERRKRVGWRHLRTSNRYFLNVPAASVNPGVRPAFPRRPTNRQTVGGVEQKVSKKGAWERMLREADGKGDLLALARRRFAAMQIQNRKL